MTGTVYQDKNGEVIFHEIDADSDTFTGRHVLYVKVEGDSVTSDGALFWVHVDEEHGVAIRSLFGLRDKPFPKAGEPDTKYLPSAEAAALSAAREARGLR